MFFSLPQAVVRALQHLHSQGHEAYIVGGCVRDLLRGVTPHDYDLCSSALPEETRACFQGERTIDTGLQHGTITVLLEGMPLEITTFRTDGDYLDGRHPQSVAYTRSLAEDLKRRDFTINAMAYAPDAGLVDLYDGQADLSSHIIRCVGDAPVRLTEDALRILRAMRFAAALGFAIEMQTAQAMHALRGRLSLISRERISSEIMRMLRHDGAVAVLKAFPDVFCAALPDYPSQQLPAALALLSALPQGDEALRLSALLSVCPDNAASVLHSLRLSRALTDQVLSLLSHVQDEPSPEEIPLLLASIGQEQLKRLLLLWRAQGLSEEAHALLLLRMQETLDARLPLRLSELAVSGSDLAQHGLSAGPQMGAALRRLHEDVLRGRLPNEREALLKALDTQ